MIVSHSPFACKWQNRFWDIEPVIAHFPTNKGWNPDIRIPRNFSELHQGQPEARVSLKKVEKQVKKRRGISHVEKFDVGSPDGHHRDNIILFCDGLARKEHPYLFSFFPLVTL